MIADAISRQTTQIPELSNTKEKKLLNHLVRRPDKSIRNHLVNLIREQRKDLKLQMTREDIMNRRGYRLIHDPLYKKCLEIWRICLPTTIVEEILTNCHKIYKHIGARKCHRMLSKDFYFLGLLNQIKKQLRNCDTCQRN